MKAILALSTLVAGAPAAAAFETEAQPSAPDPAARFCVLVQQQRSGSRRLCLTADQWQDRLGPDWRQALTGRSVDEDLAMLGTLARSRSDELDRVERCKICRELAPPRQD